MAKTRSGNRGKSSNSKKNRVKKAAESSSKNKKNQLALLEEEFGISAPGEEEANSKTISMFASELASLRKQVGSEVTDFRSDRVASTAYRAALTTVLELVPIAEEQYRKKQSEQSAYAFGSLINQMRELINDLRQLEDTEGQAEYICLKIVLPTFATIAQQLMNESLHLKGRADTLLSKEDAKAFKSDVDDHMRTLAKVLANSSEVIKTRITEYMTTDGK